MHIHKQTGGSLELQLTGEELEWFGQSLNECCNGFGVKDCEGTIGAKEDILQRLLDQIDAMYQAPIGGEG
jgi:hypothetical protein